MVSLKAFRLTKTAAKPSGLVRKGARQKKDHCVLEVRKGVKMRPSWGIKEGVKSVQTAGTGWQEGVAPAGWWISLLAGGGVDAVPWSGPAQEVDREPASAGRVVSLPGEEISMQQRCCELWWIGQDRLRLQCRRAGLDPWVGKIPWRSEWHLTPVFLPGEFLGQRSLVGYSPWGHQESDTTG